MAKKAKQPPPPASAIKPARNSRVRILRMEDAPEPEAPPVDDSGLSLEDLGQAYAAILNRGSVPYEEPTPSPTEANDAMSAAEAIALSQASAVAQTSAVALVSDPPTTAANDASCDISPKSILEAALFVGHPSNEPLTSKAIAALMRGVLPEEIDELVIELNEQYTAERCPYEIASHGPGYRLTLRAEFSGLREQFQGKVKEAKLSQGAVDTLAVVAYHQPIDQKQIDTFRSKPSGSILSQLVRRQLIQIDRPTAAAGQPKITLYRTTQRFLDLFGLDSLDDLPRGQDMDSLA